jgi:hypothetical protein
MSARPSSSSRLWLRVAPTSRPQVSFDAANRQRPLPSLDNSMDQK